MDLFGILKIGLLGYFTYSFGRIAYTERDWLTAYRKLEWNLFGLGLLVIAAVAGTSAVMLFFGPHFLSFSWFNLFGSEGTNVISIGVQTKVFGVIFCLFLLAALPSLAKIEEEIFREGTKSWPQGVKRSLIFGLTHIIVGVPLAVGFALSIAGLFFTYEYFKGGIRLSTQAHFQYNLILISVAFLASIVILF